ncbi:MAG TPA: HEAT repeat domain-containing protein [Blastocatellia bacterium]|nr:HEAT repeat domain-containing protein [Blastocatellia bacterium]
MSKHILMVSLVLAIVSISAGHSSAQRQGFIAVEGATLRARLDSAERQGRGRQTRFWTAYSFDVRPGVAVDYEWRSGGNTTIIDGTSVSVGSKTETRNLGVFVLHEPGDGALARVEIYNLDRQREYSGYPVYWLGRAGNEESLNYLQGLAESNRTGDRPRNSIVAIALHDDPRVGGMLENFVRNSQVDGVRSAAVFWLGQIPGHLSFLADLVRNEQESTKVRKEAAFAIGVGREQGSMAALENLYSSINSREVKKQIIFAASVNKDDVTGSTSNDNDGVNFMIKVAESDPDRELRKQALFWLGQKAGKRSLEVLGNVIEKSDDDTEVQKQAVFAISQRKRDEAIPLLIKIAKTHPKAEVRKQAMFWLGQTGDDRALEFFKEILSK